MENNSEMQHLIEDKENIHAGKGEKVTVGRRGVLGDLDTNIQAQREVNVGIVPVAAAEYEKKAISNRPAVKSELKIDDTGLAVKPVQSSSRRRQQNIESAAARSKITLACCSGNSDSQEIQLPDDIESIDAADKNGSSVWSIYNKDIFKHLKELEDQYPIEEDHLKNQPLISGEMRERLLDWLVNLYRYFQLHLETFQLAIGIIDRYLQAVPNVQRHRFQLIGVTALYIASKYEDVCPLHVFHFVQLMRQYSNEELVRCEIEILTKIGFSLARPVPVIFLHRYIKAAKTNQVLEEQSKHCHLAEYFVDLCLMKYTMAHYRPSELAAAAICLSLHLLDNKPLNEVWTPTLRYYSEYSLQHIEPIIKKIAKVVVKAEKCKFRAIYDEYLDVKLGKVSSLPQLKGSDIRELAQSAEY